MRSIRLTNFRSLLDTGRIEVRPITVLVGSNSSGKSSFLRFFPLLRQTVASSSGSPLLWFGRDVDFGDFSQTISHSATEPRIGLELELNVPRMTLAEVSRGRTRWPPREESEAALPPFRVAVGLKASGGKTYVADCCLKSDDEEFVVRFNESGECIQTQVNGDPLSAKPVPHLSFRGEGRLIPYIRTLPGESIQSFRERGEPFFIELERLASNGGTSEVVREAAMDLEYDTLSGLSRQLQALFSARPRPRKAATSTRDFDISILKRIKSLLFARDAADLLEAVSRTLTRYAMGLNYIGPFRANPERFYRQQELMVSQIEPHGENLAMYLRALGERELKDLSAFVRRYLGFDLLIREEGSHVSIMIKEENNHSFNLIDMGYGFSQVLPVVVQCWASSSRRAWAPRHSATSMLAVEQPELHLHPAHQARLADVFVGVLQAARDGDRKKRGGRPPSADVPLLQGDIHLLIETHSEALISRLGELVEGGSLSPEDVNVLLFDKDPSTGSSTVRQATFDKEGTLRNWPLGFFAA